jgi:hypothetical protein
MPARGCAGALLALGLALGYAVPCAPAPDAAGPSAEFVSLQMQVEDEATHAPRAAHLFYSTRQAPQDVSAAFCWRHRCSQQQTSQVLAVLALLGNSSAQPPAAAELARRVRRFNASSATVSCGAGIEASSRSTPRAPAAHLPPSGAEGGAGNGERVDAAVLMHHAEGYSELASLPLPCSRAGGILRCVLCCRSHPCSTHTTTHIVCVLRVPTCVMDALRCAE